MPCNRADGQEPSRNNACTVFAENAQIMKHMVLGLTGTPHLGQTPRRTASWRRRGGVHVRKKTPNKPSFHYASGAIIHRNRVPIVFFIFFCFGRNAAVWLC